MPTDCLAHVQGEISGEEVDTPSSVSIRPHESNADILRFASQSQLDHRDEEALNLNPPVPSLHRPRKQMGAGGPSRLALNRAHASAAMVTACLKGHLPRVVIIGGGYAGVTLASLLDSHVDVSGLEHASPGTPQAVDTHIFHCMTCDQYTE
jgi:hypothetical protein